MNKLRCIVTRLLGGVLLMLLIIGCQQTSQSRPPKIIGEINIAPYGPGEVAANPNTGNIYVLSGETRVAVLRNMEQVVFLPTGDGAVSLAVDESRDWLYVVNKYSEDVTVIHGTEVITTLETAGREPLDVAVEPNSGWAYVVGPYRKLPPFGEIPVVEGNVTVISGTQVIGTISLGAVAATQAAVDPLEGHVYVGGVGGSIVVLKGLEEVARFETGSTVAAMDVNPHTGDVYSLNDAADRNLTQFKNGKFVAKLKIRSDDPTENSALRNMQVHPVTGEIYVVDFVKHEVVVVRDMEIVGRAPVGLGALKMTIDPVTGYVYVANFRDDSVTVIDGTEVITTIETGWYPYGLGVNPVTGRVYVSNTNGDTITILGVE